MVNRDSLPLCRDIPAERFSWHGPAATRHLMQNAAAAFHKQVSPRARVLLRRSRRGAGSFKRDIRAERGADSCTADITASQRRQQILGVPHFKALGKLGEINLAQAQSAPFALEYRSALSHM